MEIKTREASNLTNFMRNFSTLAQVWKSLKTRSENRIRGEVGKGKQGSVCNASSVRSANFPREIERPLR